MTKTLASIILAIALSFVMTGIAAANPTTPPGQGECGHGNTNKTCKPDPQPTKGKDCDEHGPKEGGVNEDHCSAQPSSTPTPTVSPSPTPTSTGTPSPSGSPSPSGTPAPSPSGTPPTQTPSVTPQPSQTPTVIGPCQLATCDTQTTPTATAKPTPKSLPNTATNP